MAQSRTRQVVIGFIAILVLVVAVALAIGGGKNSDQESAGSAGTTSSPEFAPARAPGHAVHAGTTESTSTNAAGGVSDAKSDSSGTPTIVDASDTLTATRVVKTGSMSLRAPRGQVQATVARLVSLATRLDGYVSSSRTSSIDGSPSGAVTLRVPAGSFDSAVSGAAALGHETSLTTSAHDVTGQYVDLGAREKALTRTRSTYLTILGQAKTIGATLAVQQRVDDVQQQIEELQGQLKVLGNQTAYGTLAVDVSQTGATAPAPTHAGTGIGAAWHRSVHRFNRGIDGIVGVLGPLLLAVLILAALAVIGLLGYRVVRHYTVSAGPGAES